MHATTSTVVFALVAFMFILQAQAGPIAYGVCQAGCATLAVACYSATGFVFGTMFVAGAPPAVVSCNTALGVCSGACVDAFFLPTP